MRVKVGESVIDLKDLIENRRGDRSVERFHESLLKEAYSSKTNEIKVEIVHH